jgi:hypothetical protein
MTKEVTPGEAIKRLEEKDSEPNNESARTNELLAARDGGDEDDPVKASLRANDPSLSRSAYTSHKSGFNEDLEGDDDTPIPSKKAKGQTKTVNK